MLKTDQKQFHVPVSAGEIGRYCIIPGDPDRCEKIAAYLDSPTRLGQRREFNVWNGRLDGELVTVCSTGIGGPSTAIAVEELANCGADTFIRVGTCGGIDLSVECGDLVIASGAVRQDGTSHEYAPPAYPATPSPEVLFALMQASKASGTRTHVGVVQSKDSFYGQHSPASMPTHARLAEQWDAWRRLGVLASEMEASTLFTVGAYRRLRTGAIFLSVWNQERFAAGLDTDRNEAHDTAPAIQAAVAALRLLIAEDRKRNS
ncbi:MAG: uridine phosphorylase [Clostridia bacterium]|nr:uridine phosphorylase [Clostridia bacterium]